MLRGSISPLSSQDPVKNTNNFSIFYCFYGPHGGGHSNAATTAAATQSGLSEVVKSMPTIKDKTA
ncbi:hypothetical protein RMAECT_1290 [Rickettsia rhipicephali str. Ect]|uniref:Uncharacterized protein n=1 Tax=Rickettsia rhipicephali str. Ect TaxID=1359199 RepID=A0A0F3PEX9_RICRH|nr:hypothetical protein RMAECT_1290 [Rickettsia rhipicephali str. Ect]